MRWRHYTRVFARLNHARLISTSILRPRHNRHFYPQRRSFHYLDGKFTARDTPLEPQPKPDWNEAIEKIMAHQELVQLQRYLGLVEPGVGESVEDVVFVCIDIEAFEFKQEIITEIGVSVLDSRSVRGVDPGDDGKAWFDLMKHLHLRPVEHKRYVNKRFVKGCADDFNFGESVEIKIKDAGRILDRVFSDPNRIQEAFDLNTEITDVRPSIMLVGHDLKNDTDYLKRLDFTTKHVAGKIDTQRMARISKSQSPGLSKLLTALSIDAKNLHNAGNDAAYTLQALVSVAVQEHRQPGNTVKTLTANKELLDAAKAIKKAEAVEKSKAAKIARKTSDGAGANKNVNSAQQPVGGNRAKKSMNPAKDIRKIPTDEKITTTKNATGAERVRSGSRSPELKGISKVRRPDSEARDPGAKIPRSVGKVSVKGKPMRRVVSSRPESAATPENGPGKIRPNSRNSTSSSGANGENPPTVGKAADQSNESRPGH